MRRDEAVLPFTGASPPCDRLALHHERTGGMAALLGLRFPPKLARARIQPYDVAVRSGIYDDVVIDGKVLGSGGSGDVSGHFALIFPEEIAGAGVKRLYRSARNYDVHHAVVDQGDGLRLTRRHSSCPRQAKLAHVLLIDLVERAEPLRVVRSTIHQPVVRAGIHQHFRSDRLEILDLSGSSDCRDEQYEPGHGLLLGYQDYQRRSYPEGLLRQRNRE